MALILHKFSRGGSDRVAAHLARGFTDAGLQVQLIAICAGGEVEDILTDLIGTDIPIRYLIRPLGPRPLDLLRGLPGLVTALRTLRPDAVISTANNTALVSAIALRLARIASARLFLKTTNPIASSRHRGLLRRLRLWSYSLIFRWTEAVWTLTPAESEEMQRQFPARPSLFRAVSNPYVTPAMLREFPARSPTRVGKTVISVARLTAQKRLDRLIAAFAHVRTPGARLLILGEGEDRPALRAQIEALGLAARVDMPGYATDVAAALADADLFVLPSDYEGLPAAVLESMAANCPVLVTDCFPGAQWLIGEGEGCAIIRRPDPQGLAAQIDDHLARARPSSLRDLAARYSIADGVRSHLEALEYGLTHTTTPASGWARAIGDPRRKSGGA